MSERGRINGKDNRLDVGLAIGLAKEALTLARAQKAKLDNDDYDAVNELIDRCAEVTAELNDMFCGADAPLEVLQILGEVQRLSDEQKLTAMAKRDELGAEFTAVRSSYETAEAYESSAVTGYDGLGSVVDRHT